MKNIKIRRSKTEIAVLSVMFVIIAVHCFTLLYPVFWALLNSLKTFKQYTANSFNFPSEPHWKNYVEVFTNISQEYTMYEMLFNTIWIAVVGLFVSTACSMFVAYALSKFRFPGRNFLYGLAIFIQVCPIVGSGAANYKLLSALNFVNNPLLIWIAWAGGFNFTFLILYGYFQSVSNSYAESAEIDGAGEWTIFLKIMVPQALPAIASMMLINMIGMWNDYNISLIYLSEYPQLGLGIYLFGDNARASQVPMYYASLILSMIPVLIVFSCFQKLILNNVAVGGLKG